MNFSNTYNRNQTKTSGFNWSSSSSTESPLFAPGLNNGPSVLNSSVKIRLAFLRKVYGILSAQLLLTALVSVAIMFSPSIQRFLFTNFWFVLVVLLGNVATTFGLLYKRNEFPTNFYLLGAFVCFFFLLVFLLIYR